MRKYILTMLISIIGTAYAGPSKLIKRELEWDDGFKCTIMIDTSSSNVRIWNQQQNTYYRYPVKYDCIGPGKLASIKLYDKDGFSFGLAECFGYSSTISGTCEYKIDNNPNRINDYFELRVTKSN